MFQTMSLAHKRGENMQNSISLDNNRWFWPTTFLSKLKVKNIPRKIQLFCFSYSCTFSVGFLLLLVKSVLVRIAKQSCLSISFMMKMCVWVFVWFDREKQFQRVQFSGKIQSVGSKNLFSYSRFMQFNFPNLHHFKRLKCEWREKRHQRHQRDQE